MFHQSIESIALWWITRWHDVRYRDRGGTRVIWSIDKRGGRGRMGRRRRAGLGPIEGTVRWGTRERPIEGIGRRTVIVGDARDQLVCKWDIWNFKEGVSSLTIVRSIIHCVVFFFAWLIIHFCRWKLLIGVWWKAFLQLEHEFDNWIINLLLFYCMQPLAFVFVSLSCSSKFYDINFEFLT